MAKDSSNDIFGYSWEQIQDMQQKRYKRPTLSGSIRRPGASESDIAMFKEFGIEGLNKKGYDGVIDRLKYSGIIPADNPRGTIIYDEVLYIVARKGQNHKCDAECRKCDHTYKHDFTSKALIIGNPDGSLTIRPAK